MEKEILATVNATLSDVSLITLDRINALTGGHGSLNIAGIAADFCGRPCIFHRGRRRSDLQKCNGSR